MEKLKIKDEKVLADVKPKLYITSEFGKTKAISDKVGKQSKYI